ncbi:hypothetical protein [Polaribacter sp. HL-MS24]|uniref:hypothetical protein n=1 Tax=Polaribacter sp. HL-MS24 TaxID=3077735 RepID=UPI002934F154|nr:hypothetical protein [Polaribacter sp. HL-MS24]WOC40365.1 hypothetical protein RRF69_00695 [Polaribacter sp. HL-MS24]
MVLFTPIAIQSFHAFEDHEQEVCISKIDQHLHQEKNDCHDFHWNSITYTSLFHDHEKELPIKFYRSVFTNKNSHFHPVGLFKRKSRGPPYFIV